MEPTMPMNVTSMETAPVGVQQFQAGQPFERAQRPASVQTESSQDEPTFDATDISLAMRQFFQSPIRSAG
jgi:hypothetical protein